MADILFSKSSGGARLFPIMSSLFSSLLFLHLCPYEVTSRRLSVVRLTRSQWHPLHQRDKIMP